MKNEFKLSTTKMSFLVLLRFLIGWHVLYEGFSKLMTAGWSSKGFLSESKWILSGFAEWIISHENVLNAVDFLNTWGLIAIGLGLILGLFATAASVSGALLLFIYYLNNPPLLGLEYTMPSEGNYLIVNKTLIEAVALGVLSVFPTSSVFGLDVFIQKIMKKKIKND